MCSSKPDIRRKRREDSDEAVDRAVGRRVDVRVAGRGFRPVLRLGAFAVGHPLESGEYRCRKDRLSGLFFSAGRPGGELYGHGAVACFLRVQVRPVAVPGNSAYRKFRCKRDRDVGAETDRAGGDSAVGPVRRAVAQTTGDARIPARRTVRQPAPAVHEMGRLRGRTAGGFA